MHERKKNMIETDPQGSKRNQRCKNEDKTDTKKNIETKTQEIRGIT